MKNSDERILRMIKQPSRMSVDVSIDEYKRQQIEKVYEYKSMGYSLKESVNIVNGDMRHSNVLLQKRKKNKKIFITFFVLMILLTIIFTSYFWYMSPKNTKAVQADNVNENKDISLSQDELILFVGSDERPDVDKGSGTSKDVPGIRTDIMTLISIPQDGSRAVITSIPRDLNIDRAECYEYDYKTKKISTSSKIPIQNNVKINSIYEQGGPQCLVKTIDGITGKNITRYAQMNFEDFSTIIDSIGGVEITTDSRVEDEILGTIIPRAGTYVLSGEKALDYARARHVIGTSMSDFDRIKRQQEIMQATLKKASNSLSPTVISQVVTKVLPNMTVDNLGINDAIGLMNKAVGMNRNNIFMSTIPVLDEENSQGNILYDEETVQDYFSSISSKRPIDGEVIDSESGYYGATIESFTQQIILVYNDKTIENKNSLEQFLSQNGIRYKAIKEDSMTPIVSTIYSNIHNSNETATMMYVLQDAKVSTEKINVEKGEGDLVIVIGEKMNIQYIPQKNIKVFIPSGVSQVKDILPVFLK